MMQSMSMDPATYEFYQSRAAYYTASGAQGQSRHLDGFLARLAPKSQILELGCGGGRDGAHILKCGFELDATDGIPAMVSKANERHDLNARLMQFHELDTRASYDAVWAHASLLHCPRSQLSDILSRIHRSLRDGGWHFANFKLGDVEGRDLLGRLHNFPSPALLRQQYFDAGFTSIDEDIYPVNGRDGTQRGWMALTVRKI